MGERDDERAVRVPPHSVEAEQSVLGALLIDNRAGAKVGALQPDGFYRHEHRVIAAAVWRLLAAHQPADVITVMEALRAEGKLADAGGMPYLNDLATSVPTAAHVDRYAAIVQQHALRRQAVRVAEDLSAAAWGSGDLDQACSAAVQALLSLGQSVDDRMPQALATLLPAWLDDLQARADGATDAIPTGLTDIDRLMCGGVRPGELLVIGARPSMGKTAVCHTLARNMGDDRAVLVLTMEDSVQMMINRQVAAAGRANLADVRSPDRARGDFWERATDGVERLSVKHLWVDDAPMLTLRDIERKAAYVKAHDKRLAAVVIDYLQLMDGDDGESRAYQLNAIARGLKRLAKRMGVCVVLLSQLSRKADESDKPPRLDHLAESGGIEQAADNIWLLWRKGRNSKKPEDKHHMQIELAKHKNGPTDTVTLWWDGATQRVESMGSVAQDE